MTQRELDEIIFREYEGGRYTEIEIDAGEAFPHIFIRYFDGERWCYKTQSEWFKALARYKQGQSDEHSI